MTRLVCPALWSSWIRQISCDSCSFGSSLMVSAIRSRTSWMMTSLRRIVALYLLGPSQIAQILHRSMMDTFQNLN